MSPLSPLSHGFRQISDAPQTGFPPPGNLRSIDTAVRADAQRTAEARQAWNGSTESPFSPNSVVAHVVDQPRIKSSTVSAVSFEPASVHKGRTLQSATQPEKGKSRWRSKLSGSGKGSSRGLGDTSSLSSTTLESQRLEEISLKSLARAAKNSTTGKTAKNINVCLSQNSTSALFWTQSSIHIWDVGTSPPTMSRAISTESACVLAAVTRCFLTYIVGTRDQKLTVKYLTIVYEATIFSLMSVL